MLAMLFHLSDAVYPRPRGGTAELPPAADTNIGLSPPTRGNPMLSGGFMWMLRSIPAHAGEPNPEGRVSRFSEVYPRPRGGTTTAG